MSYRRTVLSPLGGVESCGPQQVWDPNATFNGIKGQCMPRSNYEASQLVDPNAYPGTVKTTAGSSFNWGGLFTAIFKPSTPAPAAPIVVQPAPGMSTTTKVALASGAALLLVLIATRN